MLYYPFVTIYNPSGVLLAKVHSKKPMNESKAWTEATRISKIYLHGDSKIPIGSHAKKEVLTESELKQRESLNQQFPFWSF